jgi:hypothetical protein
MPWRTSKPTSRTRRSLCCTTAHRVSCPIACECWCWCGLWLMVVCSVLRSRQSGLTLVCALHAFVCLASCALPCCVELSCRLHTPYPGQLCAPCTACPCRECYSDTGFVLQGWWGHTCSVSKQAQTIAVPKYYPACVHAGPSSV